MSAVPAQRLTGGVFASVVLHAGLIAAFIFLRPSSPPPMPPVYSVQLIAAAPGPMSTGVVQERPATPLPRTAPTPPPPAKSVAVRPKMAPPKAKPKAAPKVATPSPQPAAQTPPPPQTPQPTAGGGPTGGAGSDVANLTTNGIDFPYPGYIRGITNAILRAFGTTRMAYTAEVRFVIRRDGSVDPESIHLVTTNGPYSFQQQALGAVESASNANAFGPLPPGFREDILPVNFRFSPNLIR